VLGPPPAASARAVHLHPHGRHVQVAAVTACRPRTGPPRAVPAPSRRCRLAPPRAVPAPPQAVPTLSRCRLAAQGRLAPPRFVPASSPRAASSCHPGRAAAALRDWVGGRKNGAGQSLGRPPPLSRSPRAGLPPSRRAASRRAASRTMLEPLPRRPRAGRPTPGCYRRPRVVLAPGHVAPSRTSPQRGGPAAELAGGGVGRRRRWPAAAAADVVAAATGEKGIGRRHNGGDWGRRLGFAPWLALLSLRG
jgi:hypothetical protein